MYSVSDSQSALNVGRNVTEPQIAVWTVRFARCFKCNGLGHIGANCPGKVPPR